MMAPGVSTLLGRTALVAACAGDATKAAAPWLAPTVTDTATSSAAQRERTFIRPPSLDLCSYHASSAPGSDKTDRTVSTTAPPATASSPGSSHRGPGLLCVHDLS